MSDLQNQAAWEVTGGGPPTDPFTIESLSVEVYRAPTARAVRTSFGSMTDRPAVLVTVRSSEGSTGYGEVWCNFPAAAAEYRSQLILSVLGPLVVGRRWSHPREVFDELVANTRLLAIQAGEPGPFSQAIAGIDIAVWDMVARRAETPLWRFLGGRGSPARVPAYASGIGPDRVAELAQQALLEGHRAFKLKVGFGERIDLANLEELRAVLGAGAPIAVDANQAWSPPKAVRWSRILAPFRPMWLEEPIAVHHPDQAWEQLAEASPIPLAGGENLHGHAGFRHAIRLGALAVIQPDVTKWGGITGCFPLGRQIVAAGKKYCPHHLGGGIGLLASAHLLAAVGGGGLLETDCNPNPLREGLARPFPQVSGGRMSLSEAPGLGVEPDRGVESLRVSTADL